MACSEANRWRFETQRGHGTIISTTLPTSHTISMHTCWSTNRELQRKRERERRGVRRFCSTKEYTKWTCFFFLSKYQPPEDRTGYRQERKTYCTRLNIFSTSTEKRETDARREKRQTVTFKSHQKIFFFFFVPCFSGSFLNSINGCMSGTNDWLGVWHSLLDNRILITHDLGSLFRQWSKSHLERNQPTFTRWWWWWWWWMSPWLCQWMRSKAWSDFRAHSLIAWRNARANDVC